MSVRAKVGEEINLETYALNDRPFSQKKKSQFNGKNYLKGKKNPIIETLWKFFQGHTTNEKQPFKKIY